MSLPCGVSVSSREQRVERRVVGVGGGRGKVLVRGYKVRAMHVLLSYEASCFHDWRWAGLSRGMNLNRCYISTLKRQTTHSDLVHGDGCLRSPRVVPETRSSQKSLTLSLLGRLKTLRLGDIGG